MDLAVVFLILGVINCVSSLSLNITPKQAHIFPNTSVSVLCQADGPISTCQFKWKNHWLEGPLVDLSRGIESTINSADLESDISRYNYFGTGLQDGQCGITLLFGRWGSRTIGCRVRTEENGWEYADMTVSVDSLISFPLIPTPREVVVQLGEDVNLLCSAEVPLTDCTFSLPGKEVTRFNQGRQSPSTTTLRYFGTGLENGQCGATLRVSDDVNGNVLCAGKTKTRREYEVSSISITVAKPPTSVVLELGTESFTTGDVMNATCTVTDSRPPANITWYLGDDVIRQDSEDNSPLELHWSWKNETKTIIQKLSRKLVRADNRKIVRCEAKHLALQNQLYASKDLRVENPPACSTLKSSSVDTICFSGGVLTSCEGPVPVGTIAHLNCKTGFELQPNPGYNKITCLSSGEWNKPIFDCLSDCGKRNTQAGKPLILFGEDAKFGEFPWHIAFYESANSSQTLICGGSLISKNIVISAAHCFWSESYVKLKEKTLFKVVAGKHFSDWDHSHDTEVQIREVNQIYVPNRYRGRLTNFASDIAVVKVASAFELSTFVNTVCVDWSNDRERLDLRKNNKGLVSGWGYTENGTQASVLQLVELPFASDESCIKSLKSDLWTSFTQDKFCAGYLERNISVCRGDSGGGIVFRNEHTEKYYLRGVVSISFAPADYAGNCFAQLYTGFTKFSEFRRWIQGFI